MQQPPEANKGSEAIRTIKPCGAATSKTTACH